jgi:L-cystine uptake protein TcyP (sodium:dicarboxylate symporter family)
MGKWMFALLAVLVVTISGCASSGGASTMASADDGGLPEIMPYDEAPVEPLPDMVPAEM